MNIFITGCSSGIGYYCAHALKEAGHNVYATCRYQEDVKRLEEEGLKAYKLDLRESKSIIKALSWVLMQTDSKIDILFNNAGFGQPGAVEDLKRHVLKEQFETNVFGVQELTNLVLPFMRKNGFGKVIYNSSILGFVAMKYRGAYNASKYALEGLCDTLRLEVRGSGIDVILLEPGPIESHFRKNALKKFEENIDKENSSHKIVYEQTLKRLENEGKTPFSLEPEAVFKVLLEIIENPNPKARYSITFPTKLFRVLKRVLPDKVLDYILSKID